MTRKLVILIGLPGSRKSQWARRQRNAETCLFSWQALLRDFWALEGDGQLPGRVGAMGGLLRTLAMDQSKSTETLIVAATNHACYLREPLADLARESKREFVAEWFDVPADLCLQRSGLSKTAVGRETFEKIFDEWQDITPKEGFAEVHIHTGRRRRSHIETATRKSGNRLVKKLAAVLGRKR